MNDNEQEKLKGLLSKATEYQTKIPSFDATFSSQLKLPKLPEYLDKSLDLHKKLISSISSPVFKGIPQVGSAFKDTFKIGKIFDSAVAFKPTFQELNNWHNFFEKYKDSLQFAAQIGWFTQENDDFDIGQQISLHKDNPLLLDQFFINNTRTKIPQIKNHLSQDYPEYSSLIKEAFKLHQEDRFYASIPLFLMISEGIVNNISGGKSPFKTQKNKYQIAQWIDEQELVGDIDIVLGDILGSKHALSKSKLGELNRHNILHGRDVNYGTEKNSLKAISFLGFVGWYLKPFIKRDDNT